VSFHPLRAPRSSYTKIKDGDLILADASEDTNECGEPVELLGCLNSDVVSGLHTIHCRDKKNFSVPGFKAYLFQSGGIKKQLYRLCEGTKIYSISPSTLNEVVLNFPSNEEQQKVVKLLNLLEQRIVVQRKIIEEKVKLKKSLSDLIFDDLSGEKHRFLDLYSKAGEGGTPDTTQENYYKDGRIPFIQIEDLKEKYIRKNRYSITEEGVKNSSAWLVPSNSVLFSNGASIGNVSINTYPVTTKQGILSIVPNHLVSTEFLFYMMTSQMFLRKIKSITTKGTMETAYLKDINTIQVIVPSTKTQQIFSTELGAFDTSVQMEKSFISSLEKIKEYLLSALFI
jgi:type I restriction enzyme S subunit